MIRQTSRLQIFPHLDPEGGGGWLVRNFYNTVNTATYSNIEEAVEEASGMK